MVAIAKMSSGGVRYLRRADRSLSKSVWRNQSLEGSSHQLFFTDVLAILSTRRKSQIIVSQIVCDMEAHSEGRSAAVKFLFGFWPQAKRTRDMLCKHAFSC